MFGNWRLAKKDRYEEMRHQARSYWDMELIRRLPDSQLRKAIDLLEPSKSQVRQDIFALAELDFMQGGFFVEFGATNGVQWSNSWLMEKHFGWKGLLAEPDRRWHDDLRANRDATIDTRCVSDVTGAQVEFVQAPRAANSSMAQYVPLRRRIRSNSYKVETVSFNDFLTQHEAPKVIDYASLDTEGSENQIMEAFDFDRWQFRVISLEHNWDPRREEMYQLMTANGYRRVMEEVSRFDDWYVHAG